MFAERSFIGLFLYSILFSNTNSFPFLCFLDVCLVKDAALQLFGWWRCLDLEIHIQVYKCILLQGLSQITLLSSCLQRLSLYAFFLCTMSILECRETLQGTSTFLERTRNDQENLFETASDAYLKCFSYICYTYPRNDSPAVCYSNCWGTLATCRYQPRICPSC